MSSNESKSIEILNNNNNDYINNNNENNDESSYSSSGMYGYCAKCGIRLSKGDSVFVLAGCQCMIHDQCYYVLFHTQTKKQLTSGLTDEIYISCPGCPGVSKGNLNEQMTL